MSRRCVVSWAAVVVYAGGIIRGSGKFNLSRRNHDTCSMAPEARAAAGISETLLRISTGIEDGEDLIADLENGFRAANKG